GIDRSVTTTSGRRWRSVRVAASAEPTTRTMAPAWLSICSQMTRASSLSSTTRTWMPSSRGAAFADSDIAAILLMDIQELGHLNDGPGCDGFGHGPRPGSGPIGKNFAVLGALTVPATCARTSAMRAVFCEKLGGPEGLVLREVPSPAAGAGEV